MKQRLTEASRDVREKVATAAREFGAMSALNACIRLGIWPEADDLARWCGHLSAGCVIDSLTAAHERMAVAKWQALAARGWHLEEPQPTAEELAVVRAREAAAQREAWIAQRAHDLARKEAERQRDAFLAQATEEAKNLGRRTIDAARIDKN